MGQLLAVCSGKGGAGKSTVALWLSRQLAARSRRVLLVDLDAGLRCLDIMLSVSEQVVFDLGDVLNGRPAQDAVIPVPDCNGLYLLAAPADEGVYAGKKLEEFALLTLPHYDYVVFDLPAGLDSPLYSCLPKCARFLIVGGFEPVLIRDARIMGEKLENLGFECSLIINRFDPKQIKRGFVPNLDRIIDACCCQLIGIVPFDSHIPMCAIKGKPLKRGHSIKAFERIASRIEGEILPILKPKSIHIR